MRTGGHGHADFQMRIHLLEIPVTLRRCHSEGLHLPAIHENHDLVRLAQALDLFVAVARQANLNLILTIAREGVVQQRAAARAGRQTFDVLLLREIGAKTERIAARLAKRCAHREPADFLGGRDVAVQQGRREFTHRHVVEAVTRVVLRQQRRGVDIEREQIANGILVFGAIQAAEGFGAPGIGILRRSAVERGRQLAHDLVINFVVRPLLANRRHLARAHFADDTLPLVRMLEEIVLGDALQIQRPFLHLRVMATDAILVHDRLDWCSQGRG